MVGKKVKNPKKSSGKAARVGGLVDYMERPKAENALGEEHEEDAPKCVYSDGVNFVFDSPTAQRGEMIALAEESQRSKDPIDHYVFSWKEGEHPTPEQCDDLVKITLDEMGMSDHQCRYALHVDTDNDHLHMAVNRVHPETHKATHVKDDVDKLHRALARFEHKYGFEPEANARYTVNERGHVVATSERNQDWGVSAKARNIETRTGQKSAERIAQDEAAPVIRKAESWQQLHAGLAECGIQYQQKGSGAVLGVGEDFVKASTAGRDCSLTALEKRLGPFQPPERVSVADRKPEPLMANEKEQPYWDEFQAARRAQLQRRKELPREHDAARKQLAEAQKEERDERLRGNWKGRGEQLNQARSLIADKHAKESAELGDRLKQERKALSRTLTYEAFLAERDPEKAQEWRYRHKDEPQYASTIGGDADKQPTKRDIRDFTAQVDEKNGRVLYSSRYTATTGFIDNGQRVDIHQWKDEGTTLAALQLSAAKWAKFQVHGNDEYKAMCVKLAVENGFQITNPELQQALAQARQQRQQGKDQRTTAAEPQTRVNSPEEAYKRHRDEVRKHFHGRIDPSRLDWNIAVRMKVTGYSQQQIEQTLKTIAPKERPQERRDWNGYAANTAKRVFGQRGMMNALQQSRFRAELMQLEGRDARQIEGHEITKGRQPRTRPDRSRGR